MIRESKLKGTAAAITDQELRDLLEILYRALMMVAHYLEKRYGFGKGKSSRSHRRPAMPDENGKVAQPAAQVIVPEPTVQAAAPTAYKAHISIDAVL